MFREAFRYATLSVAMVVWILALIAQVYVNVSFGREAVGIMWFAIALQLFLNMGVAYSIRKRDHQTTVAHFASIGVVLGAIGVDKTVFETNGRQRTMAAAWLILTVIDILWVLDFSRNRAIAASSPSLPRSLGSEDGISPIVVDHSGQIVPTLDTPIYRTLPIITEKSTSSSLGRTQPRESDILSTASRLDVKSTSLLTPQTYTLRAEALYGYVRSPDDEQELSFKQGEILWVAQHHGAKWWPAKKSDGATGIVPSNYVRLLA
ncbi:hypothetical protein BDZ89DRAFT_1064713 [Hymenopellis radicata]|nr:hypothetical protein BDZ89DRAFT_1064713 [Hymenopellis radicata]